MGSVSVSGSLSRRIAEGHCVCVLASSAFLLYRNALIDIPEVLINKSTHSFPSLVVLSLLVSFLAFNRVGQEFCGRAGTLLMLKQTSDRVISCSMKLSQTK